jgi:hypothetical protein
MRVWSHELDRNGEVIMAYVKVLSQHLHGGTEDKIKKFQYGKMVSWPRFEPCVT